MSRRKGLTLMDVAGVGAGTAMVLAMWAMVSLARAREQARAIACGANLHAITQSMHLYAVDNMDVFPSLGEAEAYDAAADAYDTRKDLFDKGAACNIQAYWLLADGGLLSLHSFECPSDRGFIAIDAKDHEGHGFTSWRKVSYGLQLTSRHEKNAAYPGAAGQEMSSVVIAGDKCGVDGMDPTREWSANHYGRGANVATLMGTVSFSTRKDNRVGWNQNNVYEIDVNDNAEVAEAGRTTGWPEHPNDSFLYWADNDQPKEQ